MTMGSGGGGAQKQKEYFMLQLVDEVAQDDVSPTRCLRNLDDSAEGPVCLALVSIIGHHSWPQTLCQQNIWPNTFGQQNIWPHKFAKQKWPNLPRLRIYLQNSRKTEVETADPFRVTCPVCLGLVSIAEFMENHSGGPL